MTVTDADVASVAARLDRAVAGLRAAAGPADAGRPVPATPGWTVADVLAHLAIESDRYARELEGRGDWSATPADIAETNRRALDGFPERDVDELHAAIAGNVARYVALLGERDLDRATHGLDGGLLIAPRHGAGVLLGELVVHGDDLGGATGRRAAVRRDDAAFVIDGAWRVMPAFVDPRRAAGYTGGFEVRLRGHHPLTIRVDRGRVSIDPRPEPPDAVMSADPVAFLLLMYGRRTPLHALLRLQVVAWGRRPHRALAFQRLFVRP